MNWLEYFRGGNGRNDADLDTVVSSDVGGWVVARDRSQPRREFAAMRSARNQGPERLLWMALAITRSELGK